MPDIVSEAEQRMKGAVEFARQDFATIRTGRAHPEMFNKLTADYYGTPTPLVQLATFQSPEPRTMLITPFDPGALGAIEKAIRDSDLGVAPSNDGHAIRVVMPQLTEERRREFAKVVRAKAEDARVAIRNVRRRANDTVRRQAKDKLVSEDEVKQVEKQLDAATKKYIDQVEELLKAKETELMAV